MLKFIELIKSIGFTEDTNKRTNLLANWGYAPFSKYTYYIIVISHDRWSISKDMENCLRFTLELPNNQRNFLFDEIELLEIHFKAELRDVKLKELGC